MCARSSGPGGARRAAGATLVELVVYMVIVSVAVLGVLGALALASGASADPLLRKQALAIAESLLEEITLMPWTHCDPDDPQAPVANGPGDCNVVEAIGPEPGEARGSAATPFDNVNDYHGYASSGVTDITGATVAGLEFYAVAVTVSAQTLGGLPALRVEVSVTGPAGTAVLLHGYRTQYAPNSLQ
jgi:MSHA pilin protein MshD